jgi:hypothetical protein
MPQRLRVFVSSPTDVRSAPGDDERARTCAGSVLIAIPFYGPSGAEC